MNALWIAGGALLGAIAGSFLATLALRWPRGRSIARGRSRCDDCGTTVPPQHLVPVLSYLVLRGCCGRCRAPIDPRQPAMEVACALIGGLAFAIRPDAAGVAGALFGWVLATLALLDIDHFWLPDALVMPLTVSGLIAGLAGIDPPLADRLIGAAASYLVFALIAGTYRRLRGRTGLGAGDAKLLAAIGAWLGYRAVPGVVLAAALLGIGWCIVAQQRGRTVRLTDRLPLGALLAIAAWPAWFVTQLK